jgi:hypothetical protein
MGLPVTDRTLVNGGPAIAIFNGGYFFSATPINLPMSHTTFQIPSDVYQNVDVRVNDDVFKLNFKPVGEWESLPLLFPFMSLIPGTFVFGADVPLAILSVVDDQVTYFYAAAVTQMPNITLGATETLLDNVEFTILRKNLTDRTAANSLYSTYNLRDAATVNYTITYGANTTAAINFNDTTATVQTRLNALASITADGGVVVSGTYKSGYTVTWNTNGARATVFTWTLTGFPPNAVGGYTVTQAGAGGTVEIRLLKISPYTDSYSALGVSQIITQPYECQWLSNGTFTLTYGANTTTALAYNITAGALSTAINLLASITAAGGVTVAGNVNDGWVITFVTNGARTAITGTPTGMPPATAVKVTQTQTGTGSVVSIQTIVLYPWSQFVTLTGVKVNFTLGLSPRITDVEGTTNFRFMSLTVRAELQPDAVIWSDILQALLYQGAGAARGRSMNAGSQNLDIANTGVFVRLYGANLVVSPLHYGANQDRVGILAWESTRVVSGGVVNDLFYTGTAPIP